MKGVILPCFLLLLLSPLSTAFLRMPSDAMFPSLQGEKLIRELNLFPKESVNVVDRGDDSLRSTGSRIVERRFRFPNLAEPSVTEEDLGHHAGYYKIENSHAAR